MKNPKGAGRKPKLTFEDEKALLNDRQHGLSKEALAVKYSVSMSTVQRICKKVSV